MGGARLKLAWAAAAALAALGGATAQECPCGYVGEGCDTTGYVDEDGVTQLVEVTKFPNGTCVEENTFLCFVEDAEAFCACEFGYFGDFCEDQIEIKWATFIAGGVVLPIIILAYGIYKTRKTAVDKVPLDALVSGRASKKQLLVYRAAILVFSLGVLIHQAARNVRNGNFFRMFRFFTVWNFWLLTAYFLLATVFSFRAVFHPKSFEEKRSSRLERFLVIMMEVELPSTPFIALVVWGVLLPGALASGNTTGLLDFTSFVQHGINCFMMLGDFLLSGMRFQRSDFIFVVMWGSLYALVHSLMLIYETSVLDLPALPSYSILSPGLSILPAILIGLVFVLTGAFMLCRCFNRCKPEYPTVEDKLSVNEATEDVESAQETTKPETTQEPVDSAEDNEEEAESTLEIKNKEELKESL